MGTSCNGNGLRDIRISEHHITRKYGRVHVSMIIRIASRDEAQRIYNRIVALHLDELARGKYEVMSNYPDVQDVNFSFG